MFWEGGGRAFRIEAKKRPNLRDEIVLEFQIRFIQK